MKAETIKKKSVNAKANQVNANQATKPMSELQAGSTQVDADLLEEKQSNSNTGAEDMGDFDTNAQLSSISETANPIGQFNESKRPFNNSFNSKSTMHTKRQAGSTITFNIKRQLAILSIANSGWQRELNIVSWNEGKERYDLRDWNQDHTKMSKGIGLNTVEVKNLLDALNALDRCGALK